MVPCFFTCAIILDPANVWSSFVLFFWSSFVLRSVTVGILKLHLLGMVSLLNEQTRRHAD
jgi:hypothetical protein